MTFFRLFYRINYYKKRKIVRSTVVNWSIIPLIKDSNESEFSDGFDDQFRGDAEDREMLDGMTEVQREQTLFERREKREAEKRRWEIEKVL